MLFDAGIDEQEIMSGTGHRSEKGLRQYKRATPAVIARTWLFWIHLSVQLNVLKLKLLLVLKRVQEILARRMIRKRKLILSHCRI